MHGAGAHVFYLNFLAHYVNADQPFYGLQAGDGGETSIEAMAARYVAAIRTVQPEGPYLLGGWSMGGLIAYEMARSKLIERVSENMRRFPRVQKAIVARGAPLPVLGGVLGLCIGLVLGLDALHGTRAPRPSLRCA